MSAIIRNPQKIALRKRIKELLKCVPRESIVNQSASISKKIISMPAFKKSERISVYLSLDSEVNTSELLSEMFRQKKQVFVPSYSGNQMVMLKINGVEDYEKLPLTKWNIRQPNADEGRENANETGGLDLILMPGVAFSRPGKRCGHGMGYYDKYLSEMFAANADRKSAELRGQIEQKILARKTVLLGLALSEQLLDESAEFPIDENDVLLDDIITSESCVNLNN